MKKINYLLLTYLVLLLVMFILPFYSVENYNMIRNTTSHLGAQKSENNWIMNLTFFILGVSAIYEVIRVIRKEYLLIALIIIFGISLILIGIFQHAPINDSIDYNKFEDKLHSLFATITGTSFTIFAFSTVFIETKKTQRISAFLISIVATILSMLMMILPEYMGLFQRVMFVLTFLWLVYFIESRKKEGFK